MVEVSLFWLVLCPKKSIAAQAKFLQSFWAKWVSDVEKGPYLIYEELLMRFGSLERLQVKSIQTFVWFIYHFFPDSNLLSSVGLIRPVWGLMHLLEALVTLSTLNHFPFWLLYLCKEDTRHSHTGSCYLHTTACGTVRSVWRRLGAVIGEDVCVCWYCSTTCLL